MNRRGFIKRMASGVLAVSLYPDDFLGRSQVAVPGLAQRHGLAIGDLVAIDDISGTIRAYQPGDYALGYIVSQNSMVDICHYRKMQKMTIALLEQQSNLIVTQVKE